MSVSCLINQKSRTRSFLRSLPNLTFCDSKTQGGPLDSFPSFQSIPDVSFCVGLESVSVKGAAGRGRREAKLWGKHGNSLNHKLWPWTRPGSADVSQLCIICLMNHPRKWCSGTHHSLVPSATSSSHRLGWSFLSRHLVGSKRPTGLYLCCRLSRLRTKAVWWQRRYHPELKYAPITRQWKQLLQACAVMQRKQTLLMIQELVFLNPFRFPKMNQYLTQKNLGAQLKQLSR